MDVISDQALKKRQGQLFVRSDVLSDDEIEGQQRVSGPEGEDGGGGEGTEGLSAAADAATGSDTDTNDGETDLSGRNVAEQTNPLIITRSERTLLAGLHSFLDTPRQAKRVLNVYRLLKAPLDTQDRSMLEDSDRGHYQLVLLLLAILYGRPALAAKLLRRLY